MFCKIGQNKIVSWNNCFLEEKYGYFIFNGKSLHLQKSLSVIMEVYIQPGQGWVYYHASRETCIGACFLHILRFNTLKLLMLYTILVVNCFIFIFNFRSIFPHHIWVVLWKNSPGQSTNLLKNFNSLYGKWTSISMNTKILVQSSQKLQFSVR